MRAVSFERQGLSPGGLAGSRQVVDLMDALHASIGQEQAPKPTKKQKKAAGQKEMLLPIDGKKPAKEAAAKKTTSKAQRRSA